MSKEVYNCYDCNKNIEYSEQDGEIILSGAKLLKYKTGEFKEVSIIKCNPCFEKDPSLHDFQETEVYSRIVGYIRPTRQWNPGKQTEFSERKTFDLN